MPFLMKFLEIAIFVTVVTGDLLRPVIVHGNDHKTCLSQNERLVALHDIKATVDSSLQNTILYLALNCGPGEWHQVASLNMSDPSQQCPSAWREYNTSGVRACGRPTTSNGSCLGTVYATDCQYSRVCGRAIGYQIGSPDAFGYLAVSQIDSYYVYGVSITHGTPRNHIWTYAAGVSEGGYHYKETNCPCSDPSNSDSRFPPPFVGDNYYCESGNPGTIWETDVLYNTDPLWDGEQCEGECCSNGKSPPWFSVELPNPTIDNIEVRICNAQGTYDETLVQLLEVYIQ